MSLLINSSCYWLRFYTYSLKENANQAEITLKCQLIQHLTTLTWIYLTSAEKKKISLEEKQNRDVEKLLQK